MNYATVCSGIGAPEAAWAELWGAPVFTSEIEPFPSAVLKHHYPDVPNHGDMTKYKDWPDHDLDVLIGGTPCQAFSVAGLRRSLEDDRGNLTITFLGLVRRYQPRFTVWENVPGVLNTSDNAFGQFLGGITGHDAELRPAGGRWTSSGFVIGPERVAAWRVLDAQYFGVPQRRRRVFLVSSPRELGFAPLSILFESQGMRGDTPPGGKEGEGVAGYAGGSIKNPSHWDGGPHPPLTQSHNTGGVGGSNQEIFSQRGAYLVPDKAGTLTSRYGASSGQDLRDMEGAFIVVNARQDPIVTEKAQPLDQKGNSQAVAFRACGQEGFTPSDVSPPVCASDGGGAGTPTIAIRTAQTNANGHGIAEDKAHTLDGAQGQAVAFKVRCGCEGGGKGYLGSEDKAMTLSTTHDQDIFHDSIVRRLTPMECERLQGFPDDFTLIPWRNGMATDGHRYKALGNSMAVPVVRFIGQRIQLWEELQA